jgi:hypothetical protein
MTNEMTPLISSNFSDYLSLGRHCRGRMVVGFTTTYVILVYCISGSIQIN